MGSPRRPLFMDQTEGFSEEMADDDEITLGKLTIDGTGTGIDMGGKKITNGAPGTAAADLVTKQQLDDAIISGGRSKEALLVDEQLDNTDGFNAAMALYFANIPTAGDTVVLKNGALTRTYTFVANQGAESADTDVSIESSAVTAMQRLVARANADSGNTQWDLVFKTTLNAINTDGVVVAYEKATAAGASDSRIYGTFNTQADFQVLEFATGTTPTVDLDYTDKTSATASTTDPGYGRFGLRRLKSALIDGNYHLVLATNEKWSWDASASAGTGAWQQMTGSASHTHAHSDITGVGANDHHNRSHAISSTSDHTESGLTAGEVLRASGATTFAWGQLGHGDLSGVGTDTHHSQSHVLDGGDHTVSGLTTGHVLTATGAATFGFQAPGAASEVPTVENSWTTATDTVAVADPVYANGSNTVGKSLASDNAKSRVLGIIRTGSGAAPQSVEVVSHGKCDGVISGATPNTPYYLQSAGGIGTSLPSSGHRVIQVGFALDADTLFVLIKDFAKKAA